MADLIPWSNLLPTYNSPNQLAQQNASIQNTQASTANTNASTGLIGQQTQAADIANQGSQLSLGALKQAYAGGLPSVNGGGQSGGGGSGDDVYGGVSPDDIATNMFKNFAPIPTKPPPALQQQATLLSLGGRPEAAKALLDNYAMQVGGQNQQRQLGANLAYQHADAVDSAPQGAAFATLNRFYPNQAQMIQQAHPDATPAELDGYARATAEHVGVNAHQYSGRPTDMQNGVLVDTQLGKPVTGQSQVLTGLDAGGKQKAFDEANSMVTIGDSLPTPKWKASGFPSAEAYVLNADRAARSTANQGPPPGGPPATLSQIPPSSQATPSTGQTPPQPTAAPAPKTAPAAPPAVADPALKQALADQKYNIQPLPKPQTQEDLASNNQIISARNAARTDLLKDSQEATTAASQALTYTKAAQAIMASNGNVAGLGASTKASIDQAMHAAGWTQGVTASNYTELVKYLSNAALQGAKQNYGSKMTESEVKLQLDQLSPEVSKDPTAIKNLLDSNAKNLQYTLDTAGRTKAYLASNKDPQQFAEWNQDHFPRQVVAAPVTGAPAGNRTIGGVTYTQQNGKWYRQ